MGKESFGQLAQVEPSERRVLEGAVVKIEATTYRLVINRYSHTKTETAFVGGLDPTGEAIGVVNER